jgi:predicted O-linked N-acetylglucosamine transferase (SPINDLY family)
MKPGKIETIQKSQAPVAEVNALLALYNAQRYAEAESRTRALLGQYPGFGFGWKLLGGTLQMQGKDALPAFQKVAELMPKDAEAHYNLGVVLKSSGRLDAAAASNRRAVELKPDYAEAHSNLGNVLKDLGQLDAAVKCYRRALQLKPDSADAHNNLGTALKELGQLDDAVASYRRAVALKPDFVLAHYNHGNALKELGQIDDAVASYRRAVALKPDFAEAYINLGAALKDIGEYEGALEVCRRVVSLRPDSAEAHSNLGAALKDLGQLDNAVTSYRRALEIKPDYAEAHYNLGNILKDHGQYEGAAESFRQALHFKPDFADAYSNLGTVLNDIGQYEAALEDFRRALELDPDSAETQSSLLFAINYSAKHTPAYYLEEARKFGRMVDQKVTSRYSTWLCTEQPERLRVGLVSGDLRKHSVGYFLEGLLAHIDPARIELIAYPTYHEQDELTARIRPYFSAWQPLLGKSDEAAARLIHADGVHVLLDLAGHTGHNRLPVFAWKPAPVQVTWLGLPATTGVAEMDYVLGDPYALPPEFESHFTEAVWRMPDSCLCLAVPASPVKVVPLPALAAGYVTFASFNNLSKMTDAVVAVWARILKSVPNSRLLLKTKQLSDPGVCESTRQRFAACGIAPDRLVLSGTLASRDDHLAAYNKVDIALDTFPYPGVTTSVEALWMGVPVLSLRGDRFMSRTAESIANNAGLPGWVAADEDDYVAKAVAFASDLGRLTALRAGLRQQVLASPLFDAQRFARDFEDALWGMWQALTQSNIPTPAGQLSAARN